MNRFLPQYLGAVVGVSMVTGMLAVSMPHAVAQEKKQEAAPAGANISPEELERRRGMGGYHPERMKNPNLPATRRK